MDEREFEAWAKSTLGFWIDNDPPRVLSYVDGGCHPASMEEIALWDVLKGARRTTPDREAWISVDERLPETAHVVLAVNKMAAVKCVQYYHGEWIGMGGVTHWMPLPTAPTSDKGGA